MKRRDLLKAIRTAAGAAGLEFKPVRSRGDHEVFSLDGLIVPIARHRGIAEGTGARSSGSARRSSEGLMEMTRQRPVYEVTATP